MEQQEIFLTSMNDNNPENDTSIPLTVYGSSKYFFPLQNGFFFLLDM
jgi:hypothetical protein